MIIGMESPEATYKVKFTYRERAGAPLVVKECNATKEEFEQITGGKI